MLETLFAIHQDQRLALSFLVDIVTGVDNHLLANLPRLVARWSGNNQRPRQQNDLPPAIAYPRVMIPTDLTFLETSGCSIGTRVTVRNAKDRELESRPFARSKEDQKVPVRIVCPAFITETVLPR